MRDTWEVTPAQVSLDGSAWQASLDVALEQFRDELGLRSGARLTAELQSLLVYGKGQFFLPHQDSEKHDRMVATFVVMLPSVHTGGELVVDDAGTEQTYRGSREDLVLVAFYADRRHEVRPVRSGYRITLTFNLLLSGPDTPAAGPIPEASALLTEHFSTSVSRRYGGRDPGEPRRLAFLLDHEYTQRALSAGRLKGADAELPEIVHAWASGALGRAGLQPPRSPRAPGTRDRSSSRPVGRREWRRTGSAPPGAGTTGPGLASGVRSGDRDAGGR